MVICIEKRQILCYNIIPKEVSIVIDQRIKMLREAKQITAKQAAEDLSIPYTTYRNYENGVCEPNVSTLVKLSLYYNISVDWLIGNDMNEKSSPPEDKWEALRKMLETLSDDDLKEVWSFVKFLHWKKSQKNQG